MKHNRRRSTRKPRVSLTVHDRFLSACRRDRPWLGGALRRRAARSGSPPVQSFTTFTSDLLPRGLAHGQGSGDRAHPQTVTRARTQAGDNLLLGPDRDET
jgi:hypothetical protein